MFETFENYLNRLNENVEKPLFDFSKKWKKDDIARFLSDNGYFEVESSGGNYHFLKKEKNDRLLKLAKIYNCNVMNGGFGNYSEFYNAEAQLVSGKAAIENKKVIMSEKIPKINSYEDSKVLFTFYNKYCIKKDRKGELDPIHKNYKKLHNDFIQLGKSINLKIKEGFVDKLDGQFFGLESELVDYTKFIKPLIKDFANFIKDDDGVMEFINTIFQSDYNTMDKLEETW